MRQRRGFTLLEILATMTMIVIIGAALATSLFTAMRAKRSTTDALESRRDIQALHDRLSRELSNALPAAGILAGRFSGEADSLEFFTTGSEPHSGTPAGIRKIALVQDYVDTEEDPCLLRKVTANLLAPEEVEPDSQVLVRHIESLEFHYFDGTQWQDRWDSAEHSGAVPLAVEITLRKLPEKAEDPPQETSLLVRLVCSSLKPQEAP